MKNNIDNINEKNVFSCSFGVWPFRKKIELYPSALTLNGKIISFREVTGLRWGTDKVRGGIFPRYVYRVAFSCNGTETCINTKDKEFYSVLVEHFCRALLPYVIKNICLKLRESGSFILTKEIALSDGGIVVSTPRLTGRKERFYSWKELKWDVAAAALCFFCEETLVESVSLLWTSNAQVLKTMLSVVEKKDCALSEVSNFV